ncbi:transketolase family protein [Christensenella intestinihominis]|uniref:transketolase family protein n=1 Tax=Christensenella intestinihominis TaxID=1851429 RepID=UPI000832BF08|nr:transketolase C-terminal domain-containing protein [Christensenella intestinihominis]
MTEMRKVFGEALEKLMRENDRIAVIDADLGKSNGTYCLREMFPGRAFDAGVAEADMAGIAAGMTSFGYIPFICSFAPFVTRRIADQAAVSISYAKRNVKIVGTDPGITAEKNGGTHMSVEDIGIMRAIPGFVVFEPVDTEQLRQSVPQVVEYDGPVYIRMCRKETPDVFGPDYRFNLFTADVLRAGADVTVVCSGIMVETALDAAEALAKEGIGAEVVNLHTIKPVDTETLLRSVRKTGAVVTAENHSIVGGVYSAVCETLAQEYPAPVVPVGIRDRFGEVGQMDYLRRALHLGQCDIVEAARKAVGMKGK